PLNPREVLDMPRIAHGDEGNLDNVSPPTSRFAFRASESFPCYQGNPAHQSASRAVVPLREPEKRHREVAVSRWRGAAYPPVVRGQVEMVDVEARSKPPFIDLDLTLVNVLGAASFVLEPVVKPAANDGDTIWQDHHRAGAERRNKLASPHGSPR